MVLVGVPRGTNPLAMGPLPAAPFRLPSVLLEWHQKIAVAFEGNGPAVVFDKRLGNSLGT